MNRILLSTLRSTMSCQLHQGLGRASVLFACEGKYRFNGGKSASAGIDGTIPSQSFANAAWLNPDQLTERGRCRVNLTPT